MQIWCDKKLIIIWYPAIVKHCCLFHSLNPLWSTNNRREVKTRRTSWIPLCWWCSQSLPCSSSSLSSLSVSSLLSGEMSSHFSSFFLSKPPFVISPKSCMVCCRSRHLERKMRERACSRLHWSLIETKFSYLFIWSSAWYYQAVCPISKFLWHSIPDSLCQAALHKKEWSLWREQNRFAKIHFLRFGF